MARTLSVHLAVAVATSILLAGCAADPVDADRADLTLAQAKSSVQLLRNNAVSALPDGAVDTILVSSDLSEACESAATDPDGVVRAWRSGARLSLAVGIDLTATVDELVASLVEQGWEVEPGSSTASTTLAKPSLVSQFEITSTAGMPADEQAAEISLTLTSQCVVTDGANSKEVTTLEAMAF